MSNKIPKKINYNELHKLCFLNKEVIFNKIPYRHQSSLLEGFSTRLGNIENDPFIGYVGEKYNDSKVRVLLLGKANAESNNLPSDTIINQAYNKFKKATKNFDISYKNYSDTYTREMKNWRIYWNVVQPFLSATGLSLENISYVNAVPFRYKGQPKMAHYKEVFPVFTNKFISIVEPDLVIPLGRDKKVFNGKIIKTKHLNIDFKLNIHPGITRTTGDHYLPPRGKDDLSQAILDFNNLC